MSTLQDIKDAIVVLNTDIAAEKVEVQAKLADLTTKIQTLTDALASGSVVTKADLDDLSASVATIDARVKDISETSVAVPTTPAP